MNLIDGLILHTLNSTDSQHSRLMRFYQLEKEIEEAYETMSYKKRSRRGQPKVHNISGFTYTEKKQLK